MNVDLESKTTIPQRIVDHFRVHWPEDFLDFALTKHARPRHSSVQTHSANSADPDEAAVQLVRELIDAAGTGHRLEAALLWNRYTSAGFPGGEIDPEAFFDAYELLREMSGAR